MYSLARDSSGIGQASYRDCSAAVLQVRQRDDEAAMTFGRTVLKKAANSGEDQELLQDALSLLGYNDPAASPCGSLLGSKVGRLLQCPSQVHYRSPCLSYSKNVCKWSLKLQCGRNIEC